MKFDRSIIIISLILINFSCINAQETSGLFIPAYENSKALAEIGETLNLVDTLNNRDFQLVLNSYNELKKQSDFFYKAFYFNAEEDGVDSLFLDRVMKTNIALEKISDPELLASKGEKVMDAIARDYKIKTENLELGISNILSERIKITVLTEGGDGYNVFANYPWDLESDVVRETFNNPTNDAQKSLIPGIYYVWIAKNGRKIKGREITVSYREEDTIKFNVD